MSLDWLTPAALVGLTLLAVPIAIHLFARTPVTRVVVPSLRAVDPQAPRRRWRRYLRDRSLLAARLLTVAAAVLASAGPLLTTPAREAQWARRTVRAIVVDGAVSGPAVEAATARELTDVMAAEVIAADPVEGGLARALAWLSRQPPARREIVVIGDGASAPGPEAVAGIPAEVGIRVHAVATQRPLDETRLWIGGDAIDGALHALNVVSAAADPERPTLVAAPVPSLPVTLAATETDRLLVDAVWEGVVAEGAFLRSPATWRALEIVWIGSGAPLGSTVAALTADDRLALLPIALAWPTTATDAAPPAPWTRLTAEIAAARRAERIVLVVARPAEPAHAAVLLRAALTVAAGEVDPPRRLRSSDAGIGAGVVRAPQGIAREAGRFQTARDGRWLWLIAILGLVAEQLLRRRRHARSQAATAAAVPDIGARP